MSVINKEYLDLQKEIIAKQALWKDEILDDIKYENDVLKNKSIPLVEQVDLNVSIEKYDAWISELIQLIAERQPSISEDLNKVKAYLNKDILDKWIHEVLAFNEYYFESIAKDSNVSEWVPLFLAEHGIRPYLRRLAEVYAEDLPNFNHIGTCPCCGEPVRLAQLEGKAGKKVLYCPRCSTSWQEKRTKCSHCGKDHDEKMTYLQLEDDPSKQIYVCEDCKGYVKVIDSKDMIKKEEPALLDLETIHLDILAQEKGYGVTIGIKPVN